MTDAHKAALAAGREEGRAVRAYLEALDVAGPKKRGRPRTAETVERRLKAIETELVSATPLARLHLVQERTDLKSELATKHRRVSIDLDARRGAFVKVAKTYGERKGIAYATWREVGVPPDVLREAGLSRSGS